MRTATPLATWFVITALGRSATSGAISTPRFIGPGCMISASPGIRAARSGVSPNRVVYSRSVGTRACSWRSSCMRST